MTVSLNINAFNIANSRIISFTASQAIATFCVKFELSSPQATSIVLNSLDTQLVVGLNLQENIGITELIVSEEDTFQIISYECDEDDNPIVQQGAPAKTQGAKVKVCVTPTAETLAKGVMMRSINGFTYSRGDVTQRVVIPVNVIANLELTTRDCNPGQPLCSLTTTLSNDFFYSAGTVTGAGEAFMQYIDVSQGQRRIRKVQFELPAAGSTSISSGSGGSSEEGRQMREAGGYAGARQFGFSVEVEPSDKVYTAEVFECTTENKPIVDPVEKDALKNLGDSIRICIQPDAEAREFSVYMRQIASFFFEQATTELVQFAVEPGGKQAEDGLTLLLCNPGDPICVFKTTLKKGYFDRNGTIIGTGEVYLQFGNDASGGGRRAKMVPRQTQITDAAFAGASEITLQFDVLQTLVVPEDPTWQENAEDWWLNTPAFVRFLYILILIFIVSICCCCCYVQFFGGLGQYRNRADKEEEIKDLPASGGYDHDDADDFNDEHATDREESVNSFVPPPGRRSVAPASPGPRGSTGYSVSYEKTPRSPGARRSMAPGQEEVSQSPRTGRRVSAPVSSSSPRRSTRPTSASVYTPKSRASTLESPRPGKRESASVYTSKSRASTLKSRASTLESPRPVKRETASVYIPKSRASTFESPRPKKRETASLYFTQSTASTLESPKPAKRESARPPMPTSVPLTPNSRASAAFQSAPVSAGRRRASVNVVSAPSPSRSRASINASSAHSSSRSSAPSPSRSRASINASSAHSSSRSSAPSPSRSRASINASSAHSSSRGSMSPGQRAQPNVRSSMSIPSPSPGRRLSARSEAKRASAIPTTTIPSLPFE
jgi:hypothetical protein